MELLNKVSYDFALFHSYATLVREEKYFSIYRNGENNVLVLTFFHNDNCHIVDLHSFQLLSPYEILAKFCYNNLVNALINESKSPTFKFIRRTQDCPIEKILSLYFNLQPSDFEDTEFTDWANHNKDIQNQFFIGATGEDYYLISYVNIGKIKKKQLPNIIIENQYEIKIVDQTSPFCYNSPGTDLSVHHIHFSISSFNRKKHYQPEFSASIIYGIKAANYISSHCEKYKLYYHHLATLPIVNYTLELLADNIGISYQYIQDLNSMIFIHLLIKDKDAGFHESVKQHIINEIFNYHSSQWKKEIYLSAVDKEEYKKRNIIPTIHSNYSSSKGIHLNIPKSPQYFIPIINHLLSLSDLDVSIETI